MSDEPKKEKKSPVYTRGGDCGQAACFDEKGSVIKLSKSSPVFDVIGTLDELNSHLGHARDLLLCDGDTTLSPILEEVQLTIFRVSSSIVLCKPFAESEGKVSELEKQIDKLDAQLPPLKGFIVPGGSGVPASSQLHIARTVCRRAERDYVRYCNGGENDRLSVIPFVNRLSDFLFVAARWYAHMKGKEETLV